MYKLTSGPKAKRRDFSGKLEKTKSLVWSPIVWFGSKFAPLNSMQSNLRFENLTRIEIEKKTVLTHVYLSTGTFGEKSDLFRGKNKSQPKFNDQ